MAEEPSQALPDALRPVMDAQIQVKDLRSAADQPKLQTALIAVPGVESISFDGNKVSIRYDPEKVTKAGLCAAVARTGFQVAESAGATAAPPIEPARQPETQALEQEQ
jgi:hypothetical protein